MKSILHTIGKEMATFGKAAVIASLFIGVSVFAAGFSQPTQSPPNGNVEPPINSSSTAQAKAGNFAAAALYGAWVQGGSGLCIGSDCRTSWPEGGSGESDFSTTCQINTMIIHGTDNSRAQWGVPHPETGYVNSSSLGSLCANRLTQAEKDAGWMNVSFDNCPGVQGRDCSGVSYCQYVQLSCANGITVGQGTSTKRSYTAGGSGATPPGTSVPGPGTRNPNAVLD